MTTPQHAAIDTSVVVALVDRRDHWHPNAQALREALQSSAAELVYLDPVLNEAVSVLARRAHEQGRQSQFPDLLDALTHQVPPEVNPPMGAARILSPAEAILVTTGTPLLRQGTARPLHLKLVMGAMPIEDVTADAYALCHLGFVAPAACHRLMLTLALADEVLRGMTPGDPEADTWEADEAEPAEGRTAEEAAP